MCGCAFFREHFIYENVLCKRDSVSRYQNLSWCCISISIIQMVSNKMNVTNLITQIPCRSVYIIKMNVYSGKCFMPDDQNG